MAFDVSTPLLFFRHGETFYNAEGRIQGQLDTPLSPLGRAQAAEAGRLLGAALQADGLLAQAPGWFASPLARASETMEIARRALGLPGPAVVAAHGGVARALMTLIGGVRPQDTRGMPIHQGRLLAFSGGRGRWL